MTGEQLKKSAMLSIRNHPYCVDLHEACGLAHERQILEVPIPPGSPELFVVQDEKTGQRFPVQKSRCDSSRGFLLVEVAPFQHLQLSVAEGIFAPADAKDVRVEAEASTAVIANGNFELRVPLGRKSFPEGASHFSISGPVRQFRIGHGQWRGHTYFDTREKVTEWEGTVEEEGPLRLVYRYRVTIGTGKYESRVTVDAGQAFARIEEEFAAGAGDQIVWDFSGADWPDELLLLDSTAGYRTQPLHGHIDTRWARLSCWTQMSQLLDLADGYALRFGSGVEDTGEADVAGYVTLEGGTWRGNRLNQLEAWTRRWLPGDPSTRHDVPAEAKADAMPDPDQIPARGLAQHEPHLNLEGWIGDGRRVFALVLAPKKHVRPPGWASSDAGAQEEEPGHFEDTPNRALYRNRQSLLRRIHTRYGMLPLSDLAKISFDWDAEVRPTAAGFTYPSAILEEHWARSDVPGAEGRREALLSYLAARVYGFWESSGAAFTNPVVSRRIAPEMYHFEWLESEGRLSPSEARLARAHFAFLAALFASDNYYPGGMTMLPLGAQESAEPTLEGMANQNFYTDVITVVGTAAEVFCNHPLAPSWREKFATMWCRQLQYHVYPRSGLWEESHTYYQHVLFTVLPLLLRRRGDTTRFERDWNGQNDDFADADLQKLVGSALKQVTPRDCYQGGTRHLLAFGDHSVDTRYRSVFAAYSNAFARHNRELSAWLAWLHREMGGTDALDTTPVAPRWENEHVQGLGYLFRAKDSSQCETLLALRSGGAWGHHHNDETSIQFFAAGRMLVGDAGFGAVLEDEWRKFSAHGHSRWAPRDFSPANHRFRFNRGWISDSAATGPFAYAVAYDPGFACTTGHHQVFPLATPFQHWRTVVQIAAGTFLILDRAVTALPQSVRFHVPGRSNCLQERTVTANYDSCRLHICPLWPVDMAERLPAMREDKPAGNYEIPDPERLVTTEIAFDIGTASSAVLIVAAAPDEYAPQVRLDINGVTVTGKSLGEHFSFVMNVASTQIQLTDLNSGAVRTIDTQPI